MLKYTKSWIGLSAVLLMAIAMPANAEWQYQARSGSAHNYNADINNQGRIQNDIPPFDYYDGNSNQPDFRYSDRFNNRYNQRTYEPAPLRNNGKKPYYERRFLMGDHVYGAVREQDGQKTYRGGYSYYPDPQRNWSPSKRGFYQHHRGPGWEKHWKHHQRAMNGGKSD